MFGIPLPIKILAITLAVAGAGAYGYMKGSTTAQTELANYKAGAEKQIADLTAENLRISDNVITEYVDRTNTVREREIIYRDAANNLAPQTELSNGWVHLHDAAARLVNPDMQMASDLSPSGVMDNSALAVVMSNYAVCKQNSDQLIALQRWITDNRAAIEASNLEQPRESKR